MPEVRRGNKMTKITVRLALLLMSALVVPAQSVNGLWDATVQYDDYKIPFPLQLSQKGSEVSASFFNGDDPVTSTTGSLTGNSPTVRFEHYATQLNATLSDGVLKGTYGNKRYGIHNFEAKPHVEVIASAEQAPNIGGIWDLPNESPKGEHAWRLIIKQNGSGASAAILRVDGDTGSLQGSFRNGKFVLNHFDGARRCPGDCPETRRIAGRGASRLSSSRQTLHCGPLGRSSRERTASTD
jgi:hypothetical protein